MIITIGNQKGGVGKTITTVFLSQFYAFIKKMRVLLIDLDPQANGTTSLIPYEGSPTMMELIAQSLPASEAIRPTSIENLFIIPAAREPLDFLKVYMVSKPDAPVYIKDVIEENRLEENFDLILIDTHPDLDMMTASAFVASHFVVVPTEAEKFASDGFTELFKTISKLPKTTHTDVQILGVFINRYEKRTRLSKAIIDSYKHGINDLFMENHIRRNVSIAECVTKRLNLFTYDPAGNGAQDFASVGDELLRRLVQKGHLLPQSVVVA